jgi:hypothetical protein
MLDSLQHVGIGGQVYYQYGGWTGEIYFELSSGDKVVEPFTVLHGGSLNDQKIELLRAVRVLQDRLCRAVAL